MLVSDLYKENPHNEVYGGLSKKENDLAILDFVTIKVKKISNNKELNSKLKKVIHLLSLSMESGGASNTISNSGSLPESYEAIFVPNGTLPLMGGVREYNTRKGNKRAALFGCLNLPSPLKLFDNSFNGENNG